MEWDRPMRHDHPHLEAALHDLSALARDLTREVNYLRPRLGFALKHLRRLEAELDAFRSKVDLDERLFKELEAYRSSAEYEQLYQREDPRVSVCIATYNRAELLTTRCLPSILNQDYRNLEVIVVGDGCTDGTADAIARLGDDRVKFENLPERERYPEDPDAAWRVAGTRAANRAFELATGVLLTHIDDDDEYLPHRLSTLVSLLRSTRAELVWHPFWQELRPGEWDLCPSDEFRLSQVTTGSVLYLSWLKRVPWDPKCYQYLEPGDWNRFRKLKYLGVRMRRSPDPLLRHYRERTQLRGPSGEDAPP